MKKLIIIFIYLFILNSISYSQKIEKLKDEIHSNNLFRTLGSDTTLEYSYFKSFEMLSNENGIITDTIGFDITYPPLDHGAYSADWYRDVLQGDGSILNLPDGMQAAGGWYFIVAGGNTITDFMSAVSRWTRGGDRNSLLAGNIYEMRFSESGGKAIMAYTTEALINVPFEIWYLASTPDEANDDVRMIPWIFDNEYVYDVGDSTGIDVFSFVLDHQAADGEDDPYSDWIYFIMPTDDSPGEDGYNQFVQNAMDGTYDYAWNEHLARVVLMNWDRHQDETGAGQGDGIVNAMPDTGTTFRISFFDEPVVIDTIINYSSDIWLNINRMNGVFRNNGIWHYDCVAGDWGLEWPKGSGLSPIYAAGQWIGAKFPDDSIRVASSQHYTTEYQQGEIIEPYLSADPTDSKYRWYVLKQGGVGDWDNWPVEQGAPIDKNGDPLLIGDMTIFSVWNDLAEHVQYGSEKLSVEVRQTAFAYNRTDGLGDMQFIKWQLVNKSGVDLDSAYFCIWTDPDLGGAGDDLVGCDTTLGLGYCYNATNNDQLYGSAPPAVGIDFLRGPIVDNPDSTVTLPDGTVLEEKEMLKMTSFIYYNNDDSPQGNPNNANDVWNYFRAYWQDGTKITKGGDGTNPYNPPTNFMFSGDPETGEGWLDSNEADRRFIMTTGPFTMENWEDTNGNDLPDFGEPGVQEIIAAVLVARGSNNLNSVTKLKEVDELAQGVYDSNFYITSISDKKKLPYTYQLSQNYPNPFNPVTTIQYTIPVTKKVQLDIYNILGQRVAKLVDEIQKPGLHHIKWNGSNYASGLYYYRFKAGDFIQTKKLLLLK